MKSYSKNEMTKMKKYPPSIEAVATKSAVASSEMSTTDARWGLYDFMRLPVMSRICMIPA